MIIIPWYNYVWIINKFLKKWREAAREQSHTNDKKKVFDEKKKKEKKKKKKKFPSEHACLGSPCLLIS